MWDSNSWTTIKELLSFFLMLFLCLMSVQTDLLVPWCDFMKAAGDSLQPLESKQPRAEGGKYK